MTARGVVVSCFAVFLARFYPLLGLLLAIWGSFSERLDVGRDLLGNGSFFELLFASKVSKVADGCFLLVVGSFSLGVGGPWIAVEACTSSAGEVVYCSGIEIGLTCSLEAPQLSVFA